MSGISLFIPAPLRGAWPFFRGKLTGTLLGLVLGGWFGALVGLLLGHLCEILLRQLEADRLLLRYLENPGAGSFREASPGSAAFCAIAALIARMSAQKSGLWRSQQAESSLLAADVAFLCCDALRRPPSERPAFEHWASLALSHSSSLNMELLAESLASRRRKSGDTPVLLSRLRTLAESSQAVEAIGRIAATLDPADTGGGRDEVGDAGLPVGEDPWSVLGLERGCGVKAVKAAFRRLATQYHPDLKAGRDRGAGAADSADFIRMERAYREILSRQVEAEPGKSRPRRK